MIRFATCSLAALLVVGHAGPARAEDGDSRAGATKLWADAWALKDAGKSEEACEKFFTVQELYPSAAAHVQAGLCFEQASRFASAWSAFRAAATMAEREVDEAKRTKLREASSEGVARTEPRLSWLTIVLDAPTPAPPSLELLRNGKTLPMGVLGQALPIDAGDFELEVRAEGFSPSKQRVLLGEGARAEAHFSLVVVAAPPIQTPPRRRFAVPTWAWGIGGAGVAALGVAIGFAVDEQNAVAALDAYVEEHCATTPLPDGRLPCDAARPEDELARRDRSMALAIGFGAAAGVAVAASAIGIGIGLSVGTEDTARWAPWVGPGSAGLLVEGKY